MVGAIIGDINGSKYEFHNYRKKDFNLFQKDMYITDDSIMTFAVMKTFNETWPRDRKLIYSDNWQDEFKKKLISNFVEFGKKYPNGGYGGRFRMWLNGYNDYQPYKSFGNGAAMRISPVGWIAENENEVKLLSKLVTEITHNAREGLKGAEATAMAIYLARTGSTKTEIKERIKKDYYPNVDSFDYQSLVNNYGFNETCQESVPQAIYCFLISDGFEDCLRTTISIGGDCDTTAAISCAIAEAYYQLSGSLKDQLKDFLPDEFKEILYGFERNERRQKLLRFGPDAIKNIKEIIGILEKNPKIPYTNPEPEPGKIKFAYPIYPDWVRNALSILPQDTNYIKVMEEVEKNKVDIKDFTYEQVRAGLTQIRRRERFCDGYIAVAIREGWLLDVLKRLLEIINQRKGELKND